MVTVVVFEFSVMRCQPLRRALDNLGFRLKYKEEYLGDNNYNVECYWCNSWGGIWCISNSNASDKKK
nr:hypothetical protein [Vibrio cholerae]